MNTLPPTARPALRRGPKPRIVRKPPRASRPLTPRRAIAVSAWFGLAAGLMELALAIGLKPLFDPSPGLFRMNRHILWTMPTVNLGLFLVVGLAVAVVLRLKPWTAARWSLFPLCMLAALTLFLSFRRLHDLACVALACGLGYRAATWLEPRVEALVRTVRLSLAPLAAGASVVAAVSTGWLPLGGSPAAAGPASASASAARSGAPNVLLVVLDTVRADRMSLYGYDRSTTPALERLARRGVTFSQARSTAPWTLPSHASMMTGRWRHELSAGLNAPLDDAFPTLAEYLAGRGYDTAGFVANTTYAGAETGLARGFAVYEDHHVSAASALWTTGVGRRFLCPLFAPQDRWSDGDPVDHLRKNAARIRRDFLSWIDRGESGRRPFFAFLNLFDAHNPYMPPGDFDGPFSVAPRSDDDLKLLERWFVLDKSTLSPGQAAMVSDAYDDCLAYLDRQVDGLLGDLAVRGLLDETLVVVTADHGEHIGEHGLYGHASSLYDQELRVPLMVLLPGSAQGGLKVSNPVSLRDLPATVVDVLGLGQGAPFPGRSLARYWSRGRDAAPRDEPMIASVDGPVQAAPNQGRSPVFRGPMKAVARGGRVYIRNGDGREELYDVEADPGQTRDLAGLGESSAMLDAFRAELIRLTH